MSQLNITQPLGIWSIMATIRWCPIAPKWDIYQSLIQTSSCFNHFFVCPGPWGPWDPSTLPTLARALFANAMDATCGQLRLGVVVVVSFWGLLGNVPNLRSNRPTIWRWCFPISAIFLCHVVGSTTWPITSKAPCCITSCDPQPGIYLDIPSGKHTKNYGQSPCF